MPLHAVMLEGQAERASKNHVEQALSKAIGVTQEIIQAINQLQRTVGKPKRETTGTPLNTVPEHIEKAVHRFLLTSKTFSCF